MKSRAFLGVDLVEWEKAASFYRTHRDSLHDLFSSAEAEAIRQSPDPGRTLAILLAAKEAVFKAFSFPWMGRAGFRAIRIGFLKHNRLSFRFSGHFPPGPKTGPKPALTYKEYADYVIAECIGGGSGSCAGI